MDRSSQSVKMKLEFSPKVYDKIELGAENMVGLIHARRQHHSRRPSSFTHSMVGNQGCVHRTRKKTVVTVNHRTYSDNISLSYKNPACTHKRTYTM